MIPLIGSGVVIDDLQDGFGHLSRVAQAGWMSCLASLMG